MSGASKEALDKAFEQGLRDGKAGGKLDYPRLSAMGFENKESAEINDSYRRGYYVGEKQLETAAEI
jgi:hypothetical protein